MEKIEQLQQAIQSVSKKLREIKEAEIKTSNLQDISPAGFRYIEIISRTSGLTFMDLASTMGLSKPSVTIMVNKLIDSGFLTKTQSEDDKRIFHITLTEKGKLVMEKYYEAYKKFALHLSSRMNDEELDTLIMLLKKI